MGKPMTAHEQAALDRLDAARNGLSRVWLLIQKRNRTVEEGEAIVRANVEMVAATKRVNRLLEGRSTRGAKVPDG
jgi:hypothetical protein